MKAPWSLFPAVMPDTSEKAAPEPNADIMLRSGQASWSAGMPTTFISRTRPHCWPRNVAIELCMQGAVLQTWHSRGVRIILATYPLDGHAQASAHAHEHREIARLHQRAALLH